LTQDTIYVVVSAGKVADRLRSLIDRGLLDQCNKLSTELQSFYDLLKSFCQMHGGHLYVHLYERAVLEIPLSCADELVQYWDDFQLKFSERAAMGYGFSMAEAVKAMKRSLRTGEIELYDLEGNTSYEPDALANPFPQELPPNLFDPNSPPPEVPKKVNPSHRDAPQRISPEEEAAGEQKLIQQMFGGDQQQQQQRPQAQQQQQQQIRPPGNLMEALSGRRQPVPETTEAPAQAENKEAEEQELETKMKQAEEEATKFNSRLAGTIHTVKAQIPQIMGMAESNPKAFSQAMQMISKLLTLARQKQVGKAEMDQYEDLRKAFNSALWRQFHGKFPIGTTLGGKKKVLVDGKSYWRSVKSGLVQDGKGAAISVASSNLQAKPNTSLQVQPSGKPVPNSPTVNKG
jgi:hypothetical protein